METQSQIDFGKVVLKVIDLLIVRIFMLPYMIYKNSLMMLSGNNNEDTEEKVLSTDFPLYIWFLNTFNAVIVLSYPVGVLVAILGAIAAENIGFGQSGFGAFLVILAVTYFYPLGLGFMKEFLQIPLKALLYLKITSKKP